MALQDPQYEKLVKEQAEEWKVPGLTIAVIQGDEIHTKVIELHPQILHVTYPTPGIRPCSIPRK
jgi:hypothetical protein